jgi:diguanylate cyclase (GGDEF)-like protein/PAS domain S-box-containing protein
LSVSIKRRRLAALLLVLGFSSALLGLENLAARKVLSDRFGQLEREEGNRSLQQVLKALEADLNQLAISNHDYAAWDDAYQFAKSRDKRFLESNFATETIGKLNVDVVWIIDTQERDIVSYQRTPQIESGLPPKASGEVLRLLRSQLPGLWKPSEGAPLSRLLRTSQGLLAFAAHPILPTGGRGDPRALLVFARFIDDSVLKRAHDTSQLPVDLFASEQSRAALPVEAQALWHVSASESGRLLLTPDERTLNGYAVIRDVNGAPAAIVSTHIDRKLVAFGHQTLRDLMILFASVVALFATLLGALLLYLEKILHAHEASERRYKTVIVEAQETMLLVDSESRCILEANPAATTTLGFGNDELVGMAIDDLFYASDGDVLRPVQPDIHASVRPDRILIVRRKNKEFIDVEVTASPLFIEEREAISFVLRDVSARKKAERQLVHNQDRLSHLAHHDALTGLLNRLGLERRLPGLIEVAEIGHWHVAFLYLDIDHFKKINDLRGHTTGDRLLQIAAERLRTCLSADDLIVRMGGDEFVVVASQLRDTSGAATIATRIREKLAEPFEVDGQEFKITSSVGVSVYPDDGADYEVLLKNADIALYEAKDSGRDTFTLFSPNLTSRVSERLAIEHELRDAIRGGQFFLEYQPLIDLHTNRIASLEALVRWRHPRRGLVPPMQFIDIAEKAGLIADIGEFVMREACRQIGEWQREGASVVPVAVNVSSRQFERQAIVSLVTSATEGAGISPKLLHVELTESAFMDGHERHVQHLSDIRALGVEVSVDDFGTGYSSLAYLKHLPIDCLKIDRAFVRDMHVENGAAIVTAIISMAASLNLTTVAEGVETVEQVRGLRELGATYAQGFFFSPPLAADVCGRLLSASGGQSDTMRMRTLRPAVAAAGG